MPTHTVDGRKLYLDMRNPASIPYLLEREFPAERIETLLVQELASRGDVAVDIGANVGWYTSMLCHGVGQTGQVHAFEPDPSLVHLLEALCREHPHLTVRAAGIAGSVQHVSDMC